MVYLVLTVGIWMFLYSYANSHNRLTDEKIAPAAISVDEYGWEIQLVGRRFSFKPEFYSSDSKFYFISYIFAPIELRGGVLLCTERPWE